MIMLTAGGCPPGQGGLRAVQNGAMTPRTSQRGLDRNPSIWHWDLCNTPDCTCNCLARLAGDRVHPSLIISTQDMHKHKQSSDTDRAMLMSDPGGL
jgi:hypothetical protein